MRVGPVDLHKAYTRAKVEPTVADLQLLIRCACTTDAEAAADPVLAERASWAGTYLAELATRWGGPTQ